MHPRRILVGATLILLAVVLGLVVRHHMTGPRLQLVATTRAALGLQGCLDEVRSLRVWRGPAAMQGLPGQAVVPRNRDERRGARCLGFEVLAPGLRRGRQTAHTRGRPHVDHGGRCRCQAISCARTEREPRLVHPGRSAHQGGVSRRLVRIRGLPPSADLNACRWPRRCGDEAIKTAKPGWTSPFGVDVFTFDAAGATV